MDIRKVKKLIELLEESNIDELEIHEGEESVRICRNKAAVMCPQIIAAAPVATAETIHRSHPLRPAGNRPRQAGRCCPRR